MWTKNGKKLFCKQLSEVFTSNTASDFLFRGCTDTDITVPATTSVSGVPSAVAAIIPDMNTLNVSGSYSKVWHLYIGTGTTPPTENDITLENPVTFTCPVLPQISRGDNYTTLLITFTFTNNTDETKTITEIGLCSRMSSATSNNPAILFNRRLLENPVIMNAGESYTFSFTIDTSNLQE